MRFKTVLVFAVALILATGMDAFAQRGRGMAPRGGAGAGQVCMNIPDLTEDQMQEITRLRTAHLGEMQSYRDQIDINRIQYRSLMREGADMGAINSNIEERAEIRTQMEKKQAEHHRSVRNILTEDQRALFDAAPRGGIGRTGSGPAAGTRGRGAFNNPGAGQRGICPFGTGVMRNGRGFRGL
jgi:Spy/CpxP family protein refolding chaperone